MAKTYFSPALFDFLFDLDVNNDRDWFRSSKHRYENDVREPFLRFIEDVGLPLKKVSKHLLADPSKVGGSLFRIHRDVRFSKDKLPYKTSAGAQFRHEAGKDVHAPGLYLHLEPGNCFIGSGMWRPDTASLGRIRARIVDDPAGWRRTRSRVVGQGWTLGGEQLKRAPRGIEPDHPLMDDLRRTSFLVTTTLTEKQVCAAGFLDSFVEQAATTRPLLRYLGRAIGVEV